jgi:hypothetical protein
LALPKTACSETKEKQQKSLVYNEEHASRPAMQRRMLFSDFQLALLIFLTNLYMYAGEIAEKILGSQWNTLYIPTPLINRSHIVTIGANMNPIL